MNKFGLSILATMAMIFAICTTALAATSSTEKVCTTGDCKVIPATPETSTSPFTTTTNWTSVTNEQFTQLVKQYQKITKKKAVFYWREKGLPKSQQKRCIDPVRMGWIAVGGKFRNTWRGSEIGWTKWKRGDMLCNWTTSGAGKSKVATGTILRCGNAKVRIYFNQKLIRAKKFTKVTEFRSKVAFLKKVRTMTTTGSTTTTGTTTTTIYVCPNGTKFVGPDGKSYCRICPQPECTDVPKNGEDTPAPPGPGHPNPAPGTIPPPSPDDPTRSPENPNGSWQCYDETTGNPVAARPDGTCPVGATDGS